MSEEKLQGIATHVKQQTVFQIGQQITKTQQNGQEIKFHTMFLFHSRVHDSQNNHDEKDNLNDG